jgi:hypothetical protein
MKTFLQWRENFSTANVVASARGDQSEYGNRAAAGLQDVVDALRMLAEKSPQSYNFLVSKIKAEVQKVDPRAASGVGIGGRLYGLAAGAKDVTQDLGANS